MQGDSFTQCSIDIVKEGKKHSFWIFDDTYEVIYLYISGITTKPKQSECDVNSYNKDTIAICTCECPDLMKQLIFQGYGVFICTKC